LAHSQTAAFRQRVRDHLRPSPVVVAGATPVYEVVARMADAGASVAMVVDEGRIRGILTEQDVTRRIAGRAAAEVPVEALMSAPVATVGEQQPVRGDRPDARPLAEAGELDRDTGDHLRGAFDHITGLQLRQQVADFQAGRTIGNFVDPDALTARERDLLKDGFRAIDALRARLKAELTGDVF
jgi:signal-transduction protein with cAMP-binding, CBS, and nucleotidyltransferase domain